MVNVAGPATMTGLTYSAVGGGVGGPFRIAIGFNTVAASIAAFIGVGVGFGVLLVTVTMSAQVLLVSSLSATTLFGSAEQFPLARGLA